MSFVSSLVKGFGWGLGLALGIAVVSIAVDSFYVTKEDRVVQETVRKWDENKNEQETLTGDQLDGISLEVVQIDVVSGKIVIAGKLRNSTSRNITGASITLAVFKEALPIERCHGVLDDEAAPNSEQSFSAICRENWDQLNHEELSVKAKLITAWL